MRKTKLSDVPDSIKGKLDLQDMMISNENKYLMVNVLSRRIRALNEGTRATVQLEGSHTPMDTAIVEAISGMLKIEKKETEKSAADMVEAS